MNQHLTHSPVGGKIPDDTRLEYLLASMRLARANLATWTFALDEIGIALKAGMITFDAACDELNDLGLLRWLPEKGASA